VPKFKVKADVQKDEFLNTLAAALAPSWLAASVEFESR
jgi:hypothetical protein